MAEQTTNWRASAEIEDIESRARLLQDIRAFFGARQVLEVETPLLSGFATTDLHLQSFSTELNGKKYFLNTSPEYAMKRLLAQYKRSIFQICKSFRVDELGPNHNPEFTMLEWYRPGFSLTRLMDELELLLSHIGFTTLPVARLSYQSLFETYADLNPHTATSRECKDCAVKNGIEIPVGLEENVDEWLDWLLTQRILPALDTDSFTIIYDYPRSQCALAQCVEDASGEVVAERFELFYGEVELANGFFELTDAEEQQRRFNSENEQRRNAGMSVMPIDLHLISALEYGMPLCSGIAVGLDRLLMLLCDRSRIADVLSFHWENS